MNTVTEIEVLRQLVPELEGEGYDVFLHPNKPLLPAFLINYAPDAIALKSGNNLAIEVSSKSAKKEKRLERVTKLFKGQDEWEFRIIWITSAGQQKALPIQQLDSIKKRVTNIGNLVETGYLEPAFLLAWATFEATGRALAPKSFQRPQTPSRLIQALASDGYITPTEADQLRTLAEKRNKLIHGDFGIRLSKAAVMRLVNVLHSMIELAEN